MNTPTPSAQQPFDQSSDFLSRHEARRARRLARHEAGGLGWLGAVILIAIGVIALLPNFGLTLSFNWWALFILIPAVGAFGAARAAYANSGRLGTAARGALIGGIILTLVAAIFLFNLDGGLAFPVLLILAGVGLLLNMVLPN